VKVSVGLGLRVENPRIARLEFIEVLVPVVRHGSGVSTVFALQIGQITGLDPLPDSFKPPPPDRPEKLPDFIFHDRCSLSRREAVQPKSDPSCASPLIDIFAGS
jgi:hypothetical protein